MPNINSLQKFIFDRNRNNIYPWAIKSSKRFKRTENIFQYTTPHFITEKEFHLIFHFQFLFSESEPKHTTTNKAVDIPYQGHNNEPDDGQQQLFDWITQIKRPYTSKWRHHIYQLKYYFYGQIPNEKTNFLFLFYWHNAQKEQETKTKELTIVPGVITIISYKKKSREKNPFSRSVVAIRFSFLFATFGYEKNNFSASGVNYIYREIIQKKENRFRNGIDNIMSITGSLVGYENNNDVNGAISKKNRSMLNMSSASSKQCASLNSSISNSVITTASSSVR